ncbi:MAG: Outer membrane lipoprotein Omp16 precursor [Syntrophaceae bacterium PtaB.Bin038]|nr:MAG: Outer membrane lipoprotein Omp16 precursor [Syntrophaceae bacterium PtaB.Bin038]
MMRYGILLAVLMAFVLAFTLTTGCSAPKKATKEDVTKAGTKPAGPSEEELARQRAEQEARDRALREQALRDQEARERAERDRAAAEASRLKDLSRIYFDFDRAELSAEARETLGKVAQLLKASPGKSLTIEGNCDDRGTNEYNLALGQRRADSAARYLQTLGIERKRIKTISYGEERPLCSEATEACWHKNRNATFVYTEK